MAEQQHTGGMIALVPAASSLGDLAVPGGEDPNQLHTTLLYLGDDVTGWSPEQREAVLNLARSAAPAWDPVQADAWAHAHFNPTGGADGDRNPCAVYLVGGTSVPGEMRDYLHGALEQTDDLPTPPEQHTPYVPHVTAGYDMAPSDLSYTGPMTFDRLRVALGGDVTDIPLGQVDGGEGDVDSDDSEWSGWYEGDDTEWSGWYEGDDTELKVASPDPRAVRLRREWAFNPKLTRKWRPGVPGDFKRLRRLLAKYVHNPHILDGLTANIHHLALGKWPGREGPSRKSLFDDVQDFDTSDLPDDGDDEDFGHMFQGIDPDLLIVADPEEFEEDEDGEDDETTEEGEDAIPVEADEGMAIKGVLLTAEELALAQGIKVGPVGLFDEQTDSDGEQDPDDDQWADALARDKPYLLAGNGDLVVDPHAEQGKLSHGKLAGTSGGARPGTAQTVQLNGPAGLFDGI